MSSYAKLKEMALKKAEEEQAALHKERERKEREAAARLAAREAQEREQKERERKILVQRMARQKEEEARERMRKEQAAKLHKSEGVDDEKPTTGIVTSSSTFAKSKSAKTSGSTYKVDLSDRLKGSSSNSQAARRKRKVDEDDFVGNRLDKVSGGKADRKASSASTSAPKRKAVPMTREEKQAIKRAREFGSIPRLPTIGRVSASSGPSRSSPNTGVGEAESTHRRSARSYLAKDKGLVALGTAKRDHRSIDEIERDLRKLKESKGQVNSEGPSQAELEREAALLRRQKAMEGKRKSDLEARERAALGKENDSADDSKDDLFGSDGNDEEGARKRKAPHQKTINKSLGHVPASSAPSQNGLAGASRSSPLPREAKPIAARSPGGINPADFLPGAPLRPEAMARLSQKARPMPDFAPVRKSPDIDYGSRTKRPPPSDSKASSSASASAPAPAAPPKRETARDRFIREQEEKKKAATGRADDSVRKDGRRRSDSPDEYDSEDYEDEYDSEDIDDEEDGGGRGAGGGQSYRDEIWKIFGKDRKKYASRAVDSDDDMEADAASVLQEELRSSKQARQEDLREEQLEKQREREKLLRKQASKRAADR